MANISLRLPEELAQKLRREMRLARRGRSEIVREALDTYLAERERARLMADMVREARTVYGTPGQADEARGVSEDFLPAENAALEQAAGEEDGEPWWK